MRPVFRQKARAAVKVVLNTTARHVGSKVMLLDEKRNELIFIGFRAIESRPVEPKDVFLPSCLLPSETARHFLNWTQKFEDGGYAGLEYGSKKIADALEVRLLALLQ